MNPRGRRPRREYTLTEKIQDQRRFCEEAIADASRGLREAYKCLRRSFRLRGTKEFVYPLSRRACFLFQQAAKDRVSAAVFAARVDRNESETVDHLLEALRHVDEAVRVQRELGYPSEILVSRHLWPVSAIELAWRRRSYRPRILRTPGDSQYVLLALLLRQLLNVEPPTWIDSWSHEDVRREICAGIPRGEADSPPGTLSMGRDDMTLAPLVHCMRALLLRDRALASESKEALAEVGLRAYPPWLLEYSLAVCESVERSLGDSPELTLRALTRQLDLHSRFFQALPTEEHYLVLFPVQQIIWLPFNTDLSAWAILRSMSTGSLRSLPEGQSINHPALPKHMIDWVMSNE